MCCCWPRGRSTAASRSPRTRPTARSRRSWTRWPTGWPCGWPCSASCARRRKTRTLLRSVANRPATRLATLRRSVPCLPAGGLFGDLLLAEQILDAGDLRVDEQDVVELDVLGPGAVRPHVQVAAAQSQDPVPEQVVPLLVERQAGRVHRHLALADGLADADLPACDDQVRVAVGDEDREQPERKPR